MKHLTLQDSAMKKVSEDRIAGHSGRQRPPTLLKVSDAEESDRGCSSVME